MKPSQQIIQEIQTDLSKLISPKSSKGYIDYIDGLSNELKEIQKTLNDETTAKIRKAESFRDNIITAYTRRFDGELSPYYKKPIQVCKTLTKELIHNHLLNYQHNV